VTSDVENEGRLAVGTDDSSGTHIAYHQPIMILDEFDAVCGIAATVLPRPYEATRS